MAQDGKATGDSPLNVRPHAEVSVNENTKVTHRLGWNNVMRPSCMVCYKVEELRSRHDAKLQHAFLTFLSGVLLPKMSKLGLRTKSFVEMKPVSVVEHVEI